MFTLKWTGGECRIDAPYNTAIAVWDALTRVHTRVDMYDAAGKLVASYDNDPDWIEE